jgi:hypothetical protein
MTPLQCQSATATGARCKHRALAGGQVCSIHAGAAVGRKTKLTDELANRIVQVLRAGGYVETAATVAGVGRRRLNEWLARGDPRGTNPRDAVYRRFRERVERARGEAEARNVALITQAASTNWQAAAWLLERTYPERWARPSQREKDEAAAAPAAAPNDPFKEVDELAQRRRYRSD